MITIAEYAEFANKTLPLDNQAQVLVLIDAATETMEKEIDRDLYAVSPSPLDTVETFDGNGKFRIWTKQAPIDTVDSIEWFDGTNWNDVDDYSMAYEYEQTTGKVWFTERYTFHKGVDNWRITYSYGFTDGIPDDLKYACFLLTKYYSDKQSRQGIKSQSDGEQSFTYELDADVPKDYTRILAKYRRFR